MTTARTLVVLLALLAPVAAAGCKRDKPKPAQGATAKPDDRPPPITPPERKRGADACDAYVARLCKCAAQKPDLAEQCQLKQAKPEALILALGVADDPTSSRDSIVRAQMEARTIIARCIEEAAQLPTLGCN